MALRARAFPTLAPLVLSSCGFIGIDLLDAQYGALRDAGNGAEGGVPADNDGSVSDEAGPPSDASPESDGGELADGNTLGDARVSDGSVDTPSDASASDAQTPPTCAVGLADCDSTPLTCETQLGTVSNCASCGDACPANGGTAACNAGSCATICSTTGTYAVKVTIAVDWPTGFVNGGSGSSELWFRFTGSQAGNDLSGSLLPCGFTLPEFSLNPLVASELYRLTLPNTLFDRVPAYLSAVPATFSSPSGFVLGSPFDMPALALQVGASLANPASEPWPDVTALPTVDTDADGKAGVTASYATGGGYTFPRLNMTGTQRSDRAYTATRLGLAASGSMTSCSELSGSATFNYFDTHIVSCRISGGGDCTTTQRDQLDSGRPLFAPTSATLRAIKVAANATCGAVRAALP